MGIREDNSFEIKIRREKNGQKLFCENHGLEYYLDPGYTLF